MSNATCEIFLPDQGATQKFGCSLAAAVTASWQADSGLVPLLLDGSLGAGKTSLLRALVASLPGGDSAEFSSPSFNICNFYPTLPPVAHVDLYRLPVGCGLDEELLELLDEGATLLLLEWAQRLAEHCLPQSYLHIKLSEYRGGRLLLLEASGGKAAKLLELARLDFA